MAKIPQWFMLSFAFKWKNAFQKQVYNPTALHGHPVRLFMFKHMSVNTSTDPQIPTCCNNWNLKFSRWHSSVLVWHHHHSFVPCGTGTVVCKMPSIRGAILMKSWIMISVLLKCRLSPVDSNWTSYILTSKAVDLGKMSSSLDILS